MSVEPAYGVQIALVLLLGAVTGVGVAAQQAAVFPGTDWEERTPESQGLDASKLQAAVEYLKANAPRDGTDELVIIRHGFLIWKGPHIDRVHETWSVTKSFTSTVLGLLVDDGRITLDMKAQDVLPSLAVTYPDITFHHLTTMTSGYQALGDGTRLWPEPRTAESAWSGAVRLEWPATHVGSRGRISNIAKRKA